MADSEVEPHVKLLGVKLKSSAVLENIVAGAVMALVGYVLLDVFKAFSNQLGWLMPKPGSTLANAIDMAKIGFVTIFVGAFAYYINHLGLWASNEAALARLRARLAAGESAGTWYARTMRSAIFVIDRFFGDAGKARQSWKPHAFGLKKAAPLWTAASYDQCLLIALIYPMLCIYAGWAVSGDAGVAGAALGLIDGEGWTHWRRVFTIFAMIGFFIFLSIIRISLRSTNLIYSLIAMASGASSGSGLVVIISFFTSIFLALLSGANLFIIFVTFKAIIPILIIIFTFSRSIFYGATACFVALLFSTLFAITEIEIFSALISVIFYYYFSSFMINKATEGSYKHNIIRQFYVYYSFSMIVLCLFIPLVIGTTSIWLVLGLLIYFISLLTLVNAPFDWIALGITRGLLRKGLEKGGLWPIGLGLLDLAISLIIIALLSITILIVTQIFNATSALGGAEKAVFDPLPALRDLATPGQRNQPQYYWLYLMLLTTQIPAILNLAAGFLSVIRTRDFGNGLMLRLIGDDQSLGHLARGGLAAVQAGQLAVALTAGALLFYALFIGFVTVEPLAGGNLIDLLLWIAEANCPARLLQLLGMG
jgi:hypothetical protein